MGWFICTDSGEFIILYLKLRIGLLTIP